MFVFVLGEDAVIKDVRMHKVTDEVLIVVQDDGRKISIPNGLVLGVHPEVE